MSRLGVRIRLGFARVRPSRKIRIRLLRKNLIRILPPNRIRTLKNNSNSDPNIEKQPEVGSDPRKRTNTQIQPHIKNGIRPHIKNRIRPKHPDPRLGYTRGIGICLLRACKCPSENLTCWSLQSVTWPQDASIIPSHWGLIGMLKSCLTIPCSLSAAVVLSKLSHSFSDEKKDSEVCAVK